MIRLDIRELYYAAGTNAQGDDFYVRLMEALATNEKIEIDFSGVAVLTTSFLNSSLGRIADEKGVDYLRGRLKIKGMLPTIKMVMEKYLNQLQGEYA